MLDFTLLQSKDPKVKFGFSKALMELAAVHPEQVWPSLDQILLMTESSNQILVWNALSTIGHLAVSDPDGKIPPLLPRLFSLLHGGRLITTDHALFALGKIAQANPGLRPLIWAELLKVQNDPFDSPECLEIVKGKVVLALAQFPDDFLGKKETLSFLESTTKSTRNATAQKAKKLLQSWTKSQLPPKTALKK